LKVLVLGGNGFIGSHVVDQLLANGHSVRVFDRDMEKFRPPLSAVDYRIAGLENVAMLSEALEGMDVVFHLISTTVPSTSNRDPLFDIETNLMGTVRLLNLIREFSVNRIVYLSSGGTVYGNPDCTPIPESHPLRPVCSYGVVKVAIENYLLMYHQLYGLEYVTLRASNPYGERQGHAGVQGVIGTFMERVHSNQSIEIWGDGSVVRDFIYAGDLAELCVLAGNSEISGTFNAGSGEGKSINQIVEALSDVASRPIEPVYRVGRDYDVPSVVLDNQKARAVFGWSQKTCLKDGLDRSWRWVTGGE
jgi:UDP-glucose 4-epimerase